jgi:tetratricopeptide (TPR) repeat protein
MTVENLSRWQEVMQRQKLANSSAWIERIEADPDRSRLIAENYDNLLRALEDVLKTAATFPLAYRLIELLYTVSFDYADWDRWLVYLDSAVRLSQQAGGRAEQARLFEQIADILRQKGELVAAAEHYERGLAFYRELDEMTGYGRVLAKIASLEGLRGRFAQAVAYCEEALTLAEARGETRVIAHVYMNLAGIFMKASQPQESLAAAEKAYDYCRQLGDAVLASKVALVMIGAHTLLGSYAKAEEIAQETMVILEASHDLRTLLGMKLNLGIAAFNQADYLKAEALWQEALRMNSQWGDSEQYAHLCNNLGKVYTKLGEWPVAAEMLTAAIETYRNWGDTFNWANSLDNLADLYEAMADMDHCRHILAQGIAALEPLSHQPHCRALLQAMLARQQRLAPTSGL